MALTNKQQIFIDEYLKCWNATEAARRAGYQGNTSTLTTIGYENLTKPYIDEAISKRLKESAMSADEVLMRLAMHARGNIVDVAHVKTEEDLKALNGLGILIKKFKKYVSKDGDERIEVELYDSQSALQLIGKHQKLFTDRIEHSGEVNIKGYIGISPEDWDSED
jgi:phage terminase small subunit